MADRGKRLAVLISGNGSNLQAIIDACRAGALDATIAVVVSNEPGAYGLERARRAGIKSEVMDHRAFADRTGYDHALASLLDRYVPDLVVLAGFMRILTPGFVEHFSGRIINLHPSLLPKFPGLDTHRRAIEAGDREHGASVHFVTADLDAGPVIIQRRIPILPDDTPETLQHRVHAVEHQILPAAISWFLDERLQITGHRVLLDGTQRPEQGLVSG